MTTKLATCPVCGTEFKYRSNKRYCSSKCRFDAFKAKSMSLTARVNDLEKRIKELEARVFFMGKADGK